MKASKTVEIESDFNKRSFEIRIFNLNGKNYKFNFIQYSLLTPLTRFGCSKLCGDIDSSTGKCKKKSSSLLVKMKKAKSGHWA